MKEKTCTIYAVYLKLDRLGFTHRVEQMDCRERAKTYSTFLGTIKKSDIMVVKSKVLSSHRAQRLYTYCLEGQQQEALDMLKAHILDNMQKIKEEFDAVYKWLE